MAYTSIHTGTVIDAFGGRITTLESSMTSANSSITSVGNRVTTLEGKTAYLPANNAGTTGQFLKKSGSSSATWADVISVTGKKDNTQYTNMTDLFLFFTNKSVATSSWAANTTNYNFPYKADITCSGVTANYYPEVTLNIDDAISGVIAPVCESYAGGVRIFASEIPSVAIIIPTIKCTKTG